MIGLLPLASPGSATVELLDRIAEEILPHL